MSGSVFDAVDSSPIIGATVMIEGTSIGTVTDFDGNFIIDNAPDNGIIVFSYIGI